jgi:NADP+-dependent farnesol dehydrogenase
MERWQGKLAVVTGASAGIGAAIAVELVKAGMIVVGLARRTDKIEELRCKIPLKQKGNLHALELDISKEEDIIEVFKKIDCNYGGISVLVNNAGVMLEGRLLERDSSSTLRKIMDVNVFGLVNCTREAYLSMKKHGINDGHIVHINSTLGHKIPFAEGLKTHLNMYGASKFAVNALTETYRQDFIFEKTKIKVTVGSTYH